MISIFYEELNTMTETKIGNCTKCENEVKVYETALGFMCRECIEEEVEARD